MDRSTLIRAMGNTEISDEECSAVNAALLQAGCTTVYRAAMFCAQIGHESLGLYYYEEEASGAAYEGRADLGNTQPGDGKRFKGRGPLQITGRGHYGTLSRWAFDRGYVPTPTYFVDNPTQLGTVRYGFLGAVWYWTVARNMNSYADAGDIVGATRAVNGGINGLDDRRARWSRCLGIGTALLPEQGDTLVATLNQDQAEKVAEGGAQLLRYPGVIRTPSAWLRKILGRSWADKEGPRFADAFGAVVNEIVWDGYDFTSPINDIPLIDIPDTAGKNLVTMVRVIGARQTRIEKKLDALIAAQTK